MSLPEGNGDHAASVDLQVAAHLGIDHFQDAAGLLDVAGHSAIDNDADLARHHIQVAVECPVVRAQPR